VLRYHLCRQEPGKPETRQLLMMTEDEGMAREIKEKLDHYEDLEPDPCEIFLIDTKENN